MKKYELKYTKGEDGVFCMSTVENPATKTQLVMFDDEMKAMKFQDDEKRVIYSVAMRPNMLIPRKDINGEPAMVFYSEETVNDLQQNFFKNNSHNGATINHDKNLRKDMYAFESWIVQDPEKDKATSLGLQVQKGDWVMAQKVDNPEAWEDIKKGKLTGFSIEAYLEPVLTNENIEMTQEEIDARIKKILMESQLGKEYAVGEKKYYIDKMEVGGKITDAEGVAIPNAEIEVEKWKIKTDENGVITESVQEIENEGEDLQKIIDEKETEIVALKAKVAELEGKKTEMSAELAAAKKVAVEMGEELAKGIKPNGTHSKKYEEMSNVEKVKFNRGKL